MLMPYYLSKLLLNAFKGENKMKKITAVLLGLTLCFCMASCGGGNEQAAKDEPLDLTGTWTQVNSKSEDSWQEAVIEGDTIEINWISDNGDTKSLYWAGSYEAPTEAATEYEWTSNNDHEKTDSAMLASSDDTKEFTYKDGQLTYEASALGTTMTMRLEKK